MSLILLYVLLITLKIVLKELLFFFTAFPLAAASMLATSFLIKKGKL